MTTASDFAFGTDDDLVITNGDFVFGPSDRKHQEDIMLAYPGWYRNSLLCGVGVQSYEKSSGAELELQRIIRIQLEADNYLINTVKVVNTNPRLDIVLDAERIR